VAALALKEVIVGPLSTVTRKDLSEALGSLDRYVEVYKARLAFRTYTVTRKHNPAIWINSAMRILPRSRIKAQS
jgi:hypothetical protein